MCICVCLCVNDAHEHRYSWCIKEGAGFSIAGITSSSVLLTWILGIKLVSSEKAVSTFFSSYIFKFLITRLLSLPLLSSPLFSSPPSPILLFCAFPSAPLPLCLCVCLSLPPSALCVCLYLFLTICFSIYNEIKRLTECTLN